MSQRLSARMSSSSDFRFVVDRYWLDSFSSRYRANTSTWRASSITCVDA